MRILLWGPGCASTRRKSTRCSFTCSWRLSSGTFCRPALRYQRLKLYLIAYGAYRFVTEFIRPEAAWHLGVTAYQWWALVFMTALTVPAAKMAESLANAPSGG
jgi:prolipoprotein diacylglyceryltransferase